MSKAISYTLEVTNADGARVTRLGEPLEVSYDRDKHWFILKGELHEGAAHSQDAALLAFLANRLGVEEDLIEAMQSLAAKRKRTTKTSRDTSA